MKRLIKKLIPIVFLRFIRAIAIFISKKRRVKDNTVFLMLTPDHKNFGDHAIAYAELELLSSYNVIELTVYETHLFLQYPKLLKMLVGSNSIFITGGGNLGTLWFDYIELDVRGILQIFKNNKIVIFPQTIYYEDTDFGKAEFEKSKSIYNSCPDLTILAREKVSYDIMADAYNNVYLMPDMVLSLDKTIDNADRNGVMFLFREDVEKSLDDTEREQVILAVKKYFKDIEFSDMIADNDIKPQDRANELDKKFKQFCSKQLVVTDRLHGMIFSAVTSTPCIVLGCKSPKVKGIYEWLLKDLDYIFYPDDINCLDKCIADVKNSNSKYDNKIFYNYFEQLDTIIRENLI